MAGSMAGTRMCTAVHACQRTGGAGLRCVAHTTRLTLTNERARGHDAWRASRVRAGGPGNRWGGCITGLDYRGDGAGSGGVGEGGGAGEGAAARGGGGVGRGGEGGGGARSGSGVPRESKSHSSSSIHSAHSAAHHTHSQTRLCLSPAGSSQCGRPSWYMRTAKASLRSSRSSGAAPPFGICHAAKGRECVRLRFGGRALWMPRRLCGLLALDPVFKRTAPPAFPPTHPDPAPRPRPGMHGPGDGSHRSSDGGTPAMVPTRGGTSSGQRAAGGGAGCGVGMG